MFGAVMSLQKSHVSHAQKEIVSGCQIYLEFENSGNPASSRRYILGTGFTSVDQSAIRHKISKAMTTINDLIENIHSEKEQHED